LFVVFVCIRVYFFFIFFFYCLWEGGGDLFRINLFGDSDSGCSRTISRTTLILHLKELLLS
jgi:hypothetical protein